MFDYFEKAQENREKNMETGKKEGKYYRVLAF